MGINFHFAILSPVGSRLSVQERGRRLRGRTLLRTRNLPCLPLLRPASRLGSQALLQSSRLAARPSRHWGNEQILRSIGGTCAEAARGSRTLHRAAPTVQPRAWEPPWGRTCRWSHRPQNESKSAKKQNKSKSIDIGVLCCKAFLIFFSFSMYFFLYLVSRKIRVCAGI